VKHQRSIGQKGAFCKGLNTTGKSQIITDTTFFTNEPGYALLDRFKKTLTHIGSRFPESPLLKINKSLVREGKSSDTLKTSGSRCSEQS
jgi:hypothetical protein